MFPVNTSSTRSVVHRHVTQGHAPVDGAPLGQLLIVTQAVDLDDPVLGFFHRWIEEFSKHCDTLSVICLKEGRHALPANVSVYSLGKSAQGRPASGWERLQVRIHYTLRFYRYTWSLRNDYDAVFVHMNPEYVVLSGWLWRLLRKPVTLWYIHPRSSWRLLIARFFANHIVSATEKSFPLRSKKLLSVGHGIDTDFFTPGIDTSEGKTLRVMLAARIAPVKRVECVAGAVSELVRRGVPVAFDYYGTELPRDREYAETIRKLVLETVPPHVWTWKGNASQSHLRDAYREHDVHVNATGSGSFDKAVFESMACGCITVVSNRALAGVVPAELQFKEDDPVSLADTLERISRMSAGGRADLKKRMRSIAVENYSLPALIGRVAAVLTS